MENNRKNPLEFRFNKLLIAKLLAVISGALFLLVIIYLIKHPLPYGHKSLQEYTLLEWFLGFLLVFSGLAGIIGGFLITKRPDLAAWLLFCSGIIISGLFFALPYLGGLTGPPLLLAGYLTLEPKQNISRELELTQLKNMVEAGNYTEAMPRVFKLSRANPDNPEVKMLLQQWRDYKNSTLPSSESKSKE